jgi:hypothetical protein
VTPSEETTQQRRVEYVGAADALKGRGPGCYYQEAIDRGQVPKYKFSIDGASGLTVWQQRRRGRRPDGPM